jgi:hypothetical protein
MRAVRAGRLAIQTRYFQRIEPPNAGLGERAQTVLTKKWPAPGATLPKNPDTPRAAAAKSTSLA